MEFWNGILVGLLSGIIFTVTCAVIVGLRARNARHTIEDERPLHEGLTLMPLTSVAGGTPGIARTKVRMEETARAVLNPERPADRAGIEKG